MVKHTVVGAMGRTARELEDYNAWISLIIMKSLNECLSWRCANASRHVLLHSGMRAN